jgi:transcriptional regulator with XRE-family HTH domain
MVTGDKLKAFRAQKNLSQGDVEKRTGLLRRHISRIENGHTVSSVDTPEKMTQALEVPIYRLFTDDAHVKKPNIPRESARSPAANAKQEREIGSFAKLFARVDD